MYQWMCVVDLLINFISQQIKEVRGLILGLSRSLSIKIYEKVALIIMNATFRMLK